MSATSLDDFDLRENGDRQVCVLLVEDDPALQRMILNYFGENSIRTLTASGRQDMANQLGSAEVNLVILDLRLGQEDGLDLLREVRTSSDVPVIIITGHRRDDIDRVVGLELGADDYLTKPFNLRELLARVRAVLRRFDTGRATAAVHDFERHRFRFGGWQLDCKVRQLTDPAGIPVTLTKGDSAPAPQTRAGSERAERDPNRTRCRIRLRHCGRTDVRSAGACFRSAKDYQPASLDHAPHQHAGQLSRAAFNAFTAA
jgi:DNA-binding response OmpR family regulator